MSQRALLACGIAAGPLFVAAVLAQASARTGYDLGHHPISLLSLGEHGWQQICTFVATGALFIAAAVGLRGAWGSTWGPRLVGVLGCGLLAAGVFVTDAGAGFPPGAPAGAPELSWHGALHEVGAIGSFAAMLAACVVFARRFAGRGERGWLAAAIVCAAAPLALLAWPSADGFSVRLLLASAIQFAFVAALAARRLRAVADAGVPGGGRQDANVLR